MGGSQARGPKANQKARLVSLDSLEDDLGETLWYSIGLVGQQMAVAKRSGAQEKPGRSYVFGGSSSAGCCLC